MGNIKVLVRDPESVNFDRICRLALDITYDSQVPFDSIELVKDGPCDFDLDGDAVDREYGKVKGRSMTEHYAIRRELAVADVAGIVCVESSIRGLKSLCQSLAENHGKVPGAKGGSLYKKGMIPSYAKGLTLLPDRASEIVTRLVKAVAAALQTEHPIATLVVTAGSQWDDLDVAMGDAERAVYSTAREVARALNEGRYADGTTFPLAKATGRHDVPQGVAIKTRNPHLPKHLWAALKSMDQAFKVAVMVVSNPETGRVAVLCSQQYPVDIRPVAQALKARFPEANLDINVERNSIIWDPRSGKAGPTADQVQGAVSALLAFRTQERSIGVSGFRASLGDRFKVDQRRRR